MTTSRYKLLAISTLLGLATPLASTLALAQGNSAPQPAPVTQSPLQEAVQNTLVQNPDVRVRLDAFNAVGYEADAARGGYFPRVDVELSRGRESLELPGDPTIDYTRTTRSITLNQMLYDGFVTYSSVQRLGHVQLSRYYDLLDTSESAAMEVARAYHDVLRFRELVAHAEENYVQHRAVYGQIQQRVNAGVGRGVDFEQAAGRLALAESNLLTETANLHDVSARYQRLVGMLPPEEMPLPLDLNRGLPASNAEVLDRALAHNPQLRSAIESLRAAKSGLSTRKGAYHPRLDLRLRRDSTDNYLGAEGTRNQNVAEVVFRMNLFNGGSDLARVRESASLLDQARDVRDKTCRDVRQTVSIAYNDTRKLTEQLRYLQQHQLSIEKASAAYRKQFDIGQRTLLDLLDTENELFQARRAYTNAQHDLEVAYARTQAGMGNLLTTLGLARPEAAPENAKDWNAGEDVADRCPPVGPQDNGQNKDQLDERARELMAASAVTPATRPARKK